MSSDLELEVLDEVVARCWGELGGSAVLDEAGRLLGSEVSGNALMWFALRRRPGDFRLARALVRARYLDADATTVDSVMNEILGSAEK